MPVKVCATAFDVRGRPTRASAAVQGDRPTRGFGLFRVLSTRLQRNNDCNPEPRICAVAKVVPVLVVVDVNVIGGVPIVRPGSRPGIHQHEPKAAVREARIPHVHRGKTAHPEPVSTPETDIVGVLRNVVTAIASALGPSTMIAAPIAIATLRPGAVPLPSATLL